MKHLFVPALVGVALVGACASSYESRITSRLTDVGLSRPIASCMAGRMVDRLSTSQLKTLARFGKGIDGDIRDMTIGEVTRRFAGIGDPEIIEVMTRAGLGCALAAA